MSTKTSQIDRARITLALLLLLIVYAIFLFLAKPLLWNSLAEEKALLMGEFIGTLVGAFVLVAIVTTILRWRGRSVSLLFHCCVRGGLAATISGLNYAQGASLHYEPASGMWSKFVSGCSSTCRQAGQSAESCSSYCGCTAQEFLGKLSRLEVNKLLAQIENKGSLTEDARPGSTPSFNSVLTLNSFLLGNRWPVTDNPRLPNTPLHLTVLGLVNV